MCAQSCLILATMDWLSVAPLSLEFFRREYCSRLPFSFPGDLPNPGIKPLSPTSPAHRQILYRLSHWWSPKSQYQTSTKIFIQEVLSVYFVWGSVTLTGVLKKRTNQGPALWRKIGNKEIGGISLNFWPKGKSLESEGTNSVMASRKKIKVRDRLTNCCKMNWHGFWILFFKKKNVLSYKLLHVQFACSVCSLSFNYLHT